MTILHLTTYLQGGAGRCVVDLASAQQSAGQRVIVVTSATNHAGYGNYPEYVAALRAAGVAVYLIDSLFTRDSRLQLEVAQALSRILPPGEVTLLHAHAANPALIGLLFASRAPRPTPVIQTMHGWGTQKSSEQAATDLGVMGLIDAVVTTSASSARQLVDLGLTATTDLIPCGLEAELPPPASDEVSAELRRARGCGTQVLLCIGSVTANKNQRLLVEALPELRRDRPVLSAFIGEGDSAALERRAQQLHVADCVRFFGHRSDAAAYLADADLLVLPSKSEGQGLAALEAFRAGVVAVTSDTPALREIVSEPGLGFTFGSDSVKELTHALHRALSLPALEREKIAERARRRFMRRFSIEAMNDAHLALYRSVLSDRGVRVTLPPTSAVSMTV